MSVLNQPIYLLFVSEIERLDFSHTRESVNHINAWTRNITNNFIKEIVTEGWLFIVKMD